ncbi:MAG: UPF0158 family protein [Alphaproteobacteria bacterium]|uniref:UPF0158 family protein n=1 Tax=Candidatus Nitrobium versatile TaxID=2884831 RepID=A0A953JA10_9BACT|nr:UPF0158 family protein [Candidatus Nitrobium versatile]
MKKVPLDIDEVAFAMEIQSGNGMLSYLDTDTGEVIKIFSYIIDGLEAGEEISAAEAPGMVEYAEEILEDEMGRFMEIPTLSSEESYEIMIHFIETIKSEPVRNALLGTLQGKGALRRFRETIARWPELEQQWFAYHDKRLREEALRWLASIGVEISS